MVRGNKKVEGDTREFLVLLTLPEDVSCDLYPFSLEESVMCYIDFNVPLGIRTPSER